MTYRKLLLAAAISLCSGAVAHAQVNARGPSAPAVGAPQSAPPPATRAPTTSPVSPGEVPPAEPAATGLKAGMTVKDSTGAPVGVIAQVGQTPDGQPAAVVNVDGQQIGELASNLKVDPTGAQAVSSLSKAQLLASAAGKGARPG